MVKIYLAGAITHHGNPNAWRENVIAELKAWGVEGINPLKFEAKDHTDAAIVDMDYKFIDESYAVLCNANEPSWGAAMEIAYAYQTGVPVFAFGKRASEASPWLRHHCDALHLSRSDAINALHAWLKDNDHI